MPGSQLAGLRFFHVIAKLIFNVFHRRAEIPANRASPPHVIGPLNFTVAYIEQVESVTEHEIINQGRGTQRENLSKILEISYSELFKGIFV